MHLAVRLKGILLGLVLSWSPCLTSSSCLWNVWRFIVLHDLSVDKMINNTLTLFVLGLTVLLYSSTSLSLFSLPVYLSFSVFISYSFSLSLCLSLCLSPCHTHTHCAVQKSSFALVPGGVSVLHPDPVEMPRYDKHSSNILEIELKDFQAENKALRETASSHTLECEEP